MDNVTGKSKSENYCYYYLHTNGDLIHKSKFVVDSMGHSQYFESDFVKEYWKICLDDRADCYNFLIRAKMLNVNKNRINELVKYWNITNIDCENYLDLYKLVYKNDGDSICVHQKYDFTDIQECPAGFGNTIFEAICDFYEHSVNEENK